MSIFKHGTEITKFYYKGHELDKLFKQTHEIWSGSVKRPLDFILNNSRLDDESYVLISSMELDSSQIEDYKYVLK